MGSRTMCRGACAVASWWRYVQSRQHPIGGSTQMAARSALRPPYGPPAQCQLRAVAATLNTEYQNGSGLPPAVEACARRRFLSSIRSPASRRSVQYHHPGYAPGRITAEVISEVDDAIWPEMEP